MSPVARRFIVEADGGSRGNPGPAAYGAAVIDEQTGELVAELYEHIGEATNNVAEYRGALAGLACVHAIDPEAHVEVRMDSKLVVEQMSGRWQIKHAAMRDLARQVREAHPPAHVHYRWVPREHNRRADALANRALDEAADGRRTSRVLVDRSMDVVGEVEEAQVRANVEAAVRPPNRMVGWADLGQPTVTVLARHGATQMSLEKRFSGSGGTDPELAPLGIQQATALAAELAARGTIERIVASPMARTRETAAIVSQALGFPVEIDDGLAECDFGEWEGLTFGEVRDRWPGQLEDWLQSEDVEAPGGESFAQLRDRVLAARDRILRDSQGDTVLVVAHVTPIKAMVTDALDAPLHTVYRMELAPCSITTLSWFPDGNASMFGFAESAHLRGIEAPNGI